MDAEQEGVGLREGVERNRGRRRMRRKEKETKKRRGHTDRGEPFTIRASH